jgi:hypothetical protein
LSALSGEAFPEEEIKRLTTFLEMSGSGNLDVQSFRYGQSKGWSAVKLYEEHVLRRIVASRSEQPKAEPSSLALSVVERVSSNQLDGEHLDSLIKQELSDLSDQLYAMEMIETLNQERRCLSCDGKHTLPRHTKGHPALSDDEINSFFMLLPAERPLKRDHISTIAKGKSVDALIEGLIPFL